LISYEMEGSVG